MAASWFVLAGPSFSWAFPGHPGRALVRTRL